MGFWDDFAEVLKDVGTSATRIVTDTAIDLGNVATGFQFNEEMEAAKKEMSDAGILSPADAIEKNHYGFLKDMEKEARTKFDIVTTLYQEGQRVELERDRKATDLEEMLNQANMLAQMSLEAQKLLEQATNIPDWQKWADILDIPQVVLKKVNASVTKWDEVSKQIVLSGMGVNVAAGVTAGLAGLSSITKASSALKASLKASKVASVGSKAGKASKFLKIGKLAGKASVVLSVASIGLDIGLSVVELEAKKDTLEQNLRELNDGIAEANRDITSLRREIRQIRLRIYELLNSVDPVQTEGSWNSWVETTKRQLEKARERLVSFVSIREKAIKVAQFTKGQAYEDRVRLISSIDPEISEDEAKSIIADVDQVKGLDWISEATVPSVHAQIKSLNWEIQGPGTTAIKPDISMDSITCSYSLSGQSVWTRQTWTYYATAAKTGSLEFDWNYSGFHAWYKPFLQISVFVDSSDGRKYVTLLEGSQREGQGKSSIQIKQGESFGFVIKGSNYDRDSRLLGDLKISFKS